MRALVLGLMVCLTLTGCGRRGNPAPPGPSADVIYPHPYPAN
jgi:predicted small lipoprotein YifL